MLLNRVLIVCAAIVSLATLSCASHRSEGRVETPMLITATAEVNPDVDSRPSPIVVRVLQLRGDAEFLGADFFALYGNEKGTLGESLVQRDEYVLRPGEQRDVRLWVAADTRFVGVIAGFRDINTARWRALQPREHHLFHKERLRISLDRSALTLSWK
jgi:type VI secretion system protein VasD